MYQYVRCCAFKRLDQNTIACTAMTSTGYFTQVSARGAMKRSIKRMLISLEKTGEAEVRMEMTIKSGERYRRIEARSFQKAYDLLSSQGRHLISADVDIYLPSLSIPNHESWALSKNKLV